MASAPPTPSPLSTMTPTLHTTIALIDQFTTSLATPAPPTTTQNPSPLPLLTASASLLRSNVTKLSLLAITPPFTPGAISTVLNVLNDSVLPSIVTGALLVEEEAYTTLFATEARSLVKASLRDLRALLGLVLARSRGGDGVEKSAVTGATGRVWESCDALVGLANGGVGVFVVKRAEMWLGLIKDAVEEIKNWDPEEEEVDDDIFGDEQSSVEDSDHGGKHGEKDVADLEERHEVKAEMKQETLRVLERVPQSLHVVVKQRLQKAMPEAPLSEDVRGRIDLIITHIKGVSQMLDAVAEALYSGDTTLCTQRVYSVWEGTVLLAESAGRPWHAGLAPGQKKEEMYLERALEWIRQVEPSWKGLDRSAKDSRLDPVSK